jgi:hypothetical protein
LEQCIVETNLNTPQPDAPLALWGDRADQTKPNYVLN